MEFKDKIKTRRLELNLTLEEVAKKVGVSSPTIQRYESGEIKNVRKDKIKKLADALELSPAYLMGWDETDTQEEKDSKSGKDDIKTIAAHAIDDLTEEEQLKIIEFAKFIKSQRDANGK